MTLADPDYPIDGSIWGIDISHWTGIITAEGWQKMKASGCRFVIAKAMHGKNIANCFIDNYRGAKSVGIPVSHYHWLCPTLMTSVGGQARAYASLCAEYPPDFLPFTDFEWTPFDVKVDGQNKTVTTEFDDLSSFMTTWKQETDRPIGIYTSPSYQREHGSTKTEWANYPLWIANYPYAGNPPLPFPDLPKPWTAYTFWQFSENGDGDMIGTAPGERRVDLNYFNGDGEEWQAFLVGTFPPVEPPTEPPTGDGTMLTGYNKSELNLRTSPGSGFIRLMPANTQLTGDEIVTAPDGGKWLHVLTTNGNSEVGYCASWLVTYTTPPVSDVTIEQTIEQYVDGVKYIPASGNPVKFVKA